MTNQNQNDNNGSRPQDPKRSSDRETQNPRENTERDSTARDPKQNDRPDNRDDNRNK